MVKRILWMVGMVAVAVLTGCKTQSTSVSISENHQLVYNLNFGGSNYNFIVEVLSKSPSLSFNYAMTNGNNTSGKVTIMPGALDSARVQNNYFSGGDLVLDQETTVWLSKRVFNELSSTGKTVMEFSSLFGSETVNFSKTGEENFEISVNGTKKKVSTILASDTDGKGYSYRILNNPSEPLILEMNLGWSIGLKEINFN
ncbi:MAG: hypothetical protein H6607_07875 [Flavobacteriales bacterium]|nr:hypothetical protein [Flavobacteriales bacterium]